MMMLTLIYLGISSYGLTTPVALLRGMLQAMNTRVEDGARRHTSRPHSSPGSDSGTAPYALLPSAIRHQRKRQRLVASAVHTLTAALYC